LGASGKRWLLPPHSKAAAPLKILIVGANGVFGCGSAAMCGGSTTLLSYKLETL